MVVRRCGAFGEQHQRLDSPMTNFNSYAMSTERSRDLNNQNWEKRFWALSWTGEKGPLLKVQDDVWEAELGALCPWLLGSTQVPVYFVIYHNSTL